LNNKNSTEKAERLVKGDLATIHSLSQKSGELPVLFIECVMTKTVYRVIDEIVAVPEGSVIFLLEDVETTSTNQNSVVQVIYNDTTFLCISGQLKKITYDV